MQDVIISFFCSKVLPLWLLVFCAVSKQINDKERVAAALENPSLLSLVNECISDAEYRWQLLRIDILYGTDVLWYGIKTHGVFPAQIYRFDSHQHWVPVGPWVHQRLSHLRHNSCRLAYVRKPSYDRLWIDRLCGLVITRCVWHCVFNRWVSKQKQPWSLTFAEIYNFCG